VTTVVEGVTPILKLGLVGVTVVIVVEGVAGNVVGLVLLLSPVIVTVGKVTGVVMGVVAP
jgi:hypothetical protein